MEVRGFGGIMQGREIVVIELPITPRVDGVSE